MTIAILLLITIILLFRVKPKDSESYRKASMAIIGFAYFIVWRFVQYLAEIQYWEESTRFQVYLFLGVVAIGCRSATDGNYFRKTIKLSIKRRKAVTFHVHLNSQKPQMEKDYLKCHYLTQLMNYQIFLVSP